MSFGAQLVSRKRHWAVIAVVTAGMVVQPVVVAAILAWMRAGRLAPSIFFAREELWGAVTNPARNPVLDANIVYISFVKGALDSQLYLYSVRALLVASVIGLLLGLNVAAWGVARRALRGCSAVPMTSWARGTGGIGGAVGVVVGAAAGAAGCCAFGVGGGGLLVGLGVSYTAATAIGERAPAFQAAAVLVLALNLWYVARTYARRSPAA